MRHPRVKKRQGLAGRYTGMKPPAGRPALPHACCCLEPPLTASSSPLLGNTSAPSDGEVTPSSWALTSCFVPKKTVKYLRSSQIF